jgi:hypothetical protein
MKHLNGKRLKISDNVGNSYIGLCTGANDEIIKMLLDNETDEIVFFIKNIFSYVIIGEGTTGGYSGLKAFICKNENINCKGRVYISSKDCEIKDMNCEICNNSNNKFKCDFGCIGAIEILPSKVQRVLFDGMFVSREQSKNYLQQAVEKIDKENNHE